MIASVDNPDVGQNVISLYMENKEIIMYMY